jgi:hypothetical protein
VRQISPSTGIAGLTTAYEIVKEHHCWIECMSEIDTGAALRHVLELNGYTVLLGVDGRKGSIFMNAKGRRST